MHFNLSTLLSLRSLNFEQFQPKVDTYLVCPSVHVCVFTVIKKATRLIEKRKTKNTHTTKGRSEGEKHHKCHGLFASCEYKKCLPLNTYTCTSTQTSTRECYFSLYLPYSFFSNSWKASKRYEVFFKYAVSFSPYHTLLLSLSFAHTKLAGPAFHPIFCRLSTFFSLSPLTLSPTRKKKQSTVIITVEHWLFFATSLVLTIHMRNVHKILFFIFLCALTHRLYFFVLLLPFLFLTLSGCFRHVYETLL